MYTSERSRLLSMLADLEDAPDSEKMQLLIELLRELIMSGRWD
ncbi:hypothetical protein [Anaeroselena agilis]|uniref:Uncharacterized protein n=1 Tax=Anaeroselena agilis TaxID=3063788 RepID=A0ABU3NTA1_9FIRM|nr:hypothetical protein [Selenomonadales bacterium 4137-cl]